MLTALLPRLRLGAIGLLCPVELQPGACLLPVLFVFEEGQGGLLPLDGGVEVAGLGGCGGQGVERLGGFPVGQLAGAAGGLDGLAAVYRLYDRIWRPDPKNPPVTTELLRALTKAGNYVSGAFDGAELVGACVGFFSAPAGSAMHSHVAGVSAAALGRSVGFALKLHQRAWALQRGVSQIEWTFDPLEIKNAYLNLEKLGAIVRRYNINQYGITSSPLQGGLPSDRLIAEWWLKSKRVETLLATGKNPPIASEFSISVPAQIYDWKAAAETRAVLGISKVMSLSCTYDHRIIQGAESGAFLGKVQDLLDGNESFYEEIFEHLKMPHLPVHWEIDSQPLIPGMTGARHAEIAKQAAIMQMINAFRVRGHLIAHLDPLGAEPSFHP